MTEREAINQGLHYTGISWPDWNTAEKEKAKNRVAAIKAKYKVRAVIVKENNGWSSYYGDAAFRKVQYTTTDSVQAKINAVPATLKKLEEDYRNKVSETMEELEKLKALYAELKALEK